MIIFGSNKHSGLVSIAQRGLEGYTTIGREREASNAIVPAIHWTSFHGLHIVLWESLLRLAYLHLCSILPSLFHSTL
jgi:hypothetical protein